MSKAKQQKSDKKQESAKSVLTTLFLVIFISGFVISVVKISSIILETKKADKAYDDIRASVQLEKLKKEKSSDNSLNLSIMSSSVSESVEKKRQNNMDFSALKKENPNIVAWLKCEGTNIDYPVLHTDNNEFYINHLYNGDVNASGSLFVDYRNTGMFSDTNTVIYGHHMQNGTMFSALMEYKAQDFYDTHPTMMLYTPYGDYLIELISGTVEDGNNEFVRFDFDSGCDLEEYLAELRNKSMFNSEVTMKTDDRIISMCTCSYEWNNARFMLVGKLVPLYV